MPTGTQIIGTYAITEMIAAGGMGEVYRGENIHTNQSVAIKIVLAEFTYGGKLAPSFPSWLLDGRKPTRLAWWLKERVLPPLYWWGMLKGREWLAKPTQTAQEARS